MTSPLSRSLLVAATLAASLGALAATASADTIDRRQYNQERRIQQGVRSGELTRGEYARLEAEQARIRDMERRAKADGYVSPYERWQISRAQNQASRHIYVEKHDAQDRNSRRWYRWW